MNMISESPAPFSAQAEIFKLLAHPCRLAILTTLRSGEECVCHMEATLGYRQAYLSQQLAVLRQAGIIQDRRDGWNIFYRVIRPEIYPILDAVNALAGSPADFTPGRVTAAACPCPQCTSSREQA